MVDPTKEPYAEWLEGALKSLVEKHPTKIALVAIDAEGNYMSTYFQCGPMDLYALSGSLHSEGVWMEIKANGNYLREIIENGDNDESED